MSPPVIGWDSTSDLWSVWVSYPKLVIELFNFGKLLFETCFVIIRFRFWTFAFLYIFSTLLFLAGVMVSFFLVSSKVPLGEELQYGKNFLITFSFSFFFSAFLVSFLCLAKQSLNLTFKVKENSGHTLASGCSFIQCFTIWEEGLKSSTSLKCSFVRSYSDIEDSPI